MFLISTIHNFLTCMRPRQNTDRLSKKHTYLLFVWVNDANNQKDIPMIKSIIVIYRICSYGLFVWCNVIIGCRCLILATAMVSARVDSGTWPRPWYHDVGMGQRILTTYTEVKSKVKSTPIVSDRNQARTMQHISR